MSPFPEHSTNVPEISRFLEHFLSNPKVLKPSHVRTRVESSDHPIEPYYCKTSASAGVTIKRVTATGPGSKGSTCFIAIDFHGDPSR